MEGLISNFNGSNASDLAMPVDVLERGEVEFLLFEDSIIAELAAGLSAVELVLEDVNLVIQLLQLVEESALVGRNYDRLSFLALLRLAVAKLLLLLLLIVHLLLNCVLLSFDFFFAGFFVELSSHEVLVSVQIFVKIDNLV